MKSLFTPVDGNLSFSAVQGWRYDCSIVMDFTYQVTPEMLGLSWRRVLLQSVTASIIALSVGFFLSMVVHGRVLTGSVAGLVITAFLSPLLMRLLSRTKLRLTDDTIEELDGPVIRKDAIARVNEYTDSNCPGFEIVGKGKPRWLRKYRIFIPAALPEYQHVRKVVQSWATVQERHNPLN